MNSQDLLMKFVDALITAIAFAIIGGFVGLIGTSFWMWIDVRSLKKGQNAAFKKIRDLEEGDKESCARE